jgi:hypothetical protein
MMEGQVKLRKIISGGQVGADQAALRAARHLGLETGGTAPRGYRTESGLQRDLLAGYGLVENAVDDYPARSKRNVDDAQATIAFRCKSSLGTDKTIQYCISGHWRAITFALGKTDATAHVTGHRPVLIVQRMTAEAQQVVRDFLRERQVQVLNVAGHRSVNGEPGWEDAVEQFLIKALKE